MFRPIIYFNLFRFNYVLYFYAIITRSALNANSLEYKLDLGEYHHENEKSKKRAKHRH